MKGSRDAPHAVPAMRVRTPWPARGYRAFGCASSSTSAIKQRAMECDEGRRQKRCNENAHHRRAVLQHTRMITPGSPDSVQVRRKVRDLAESNEQLQSEVGGEWPEEEVAEAPGRQQRPCAEVVDQTGDRRRKDLVRQDVVHARELRKGEKQAKQRKEGRHTKEEAREKG